jgi:hypothetical protein
LQFLLSIQENSILVWPRATRVPLAELERNRDVRGSGCMIIR